MQAKALHQPCGRATLIRRPPRDVLSTFYIAGETGGRGKGRTGMARPLHGTAMLLSPAAIPDRSLLLADPVP